MRLNLSDRSVLRFDVLLLFVAVAVAFCACVSLMFGFHLPSFALWVGVVPATVGAFVESRRNGLIFLTMLIVAILLTIVSVTYAGTDAARCYVPMQRLLMHGWNPVYQSSEADILNQANGFGLCVGHIYALPRFAAVIGAVVAMNFHIFTGDAFLGFILVCVLFAVAYRYGVKFFGSKCAAIALAFVSTFSTKIVSIMNGQVDYIIYATVLSSLYAWMIWRKSDSLGDLAIVCFSTAIGFSAKATGVIYLGCVIVAFIIAERRKKSAWWMIMFFLVLVICYCWSPYVVNWINSGSPMPKQDLTSDFTGNADAMSMGWLARVTYAWISPYLAKTFCGWFHGNPDFDPQFALCATGIGVWFDILMILSIFWLLLSRKNSITFLCVFIFVSTNLLPIKYIGYIRYQYQIWVIPWLALLNFIFNPCPHLAWLERLRLLRLPVCCFLMALSAMVVLRFSAIVVRMNAFEHSRLSFMEQIRQTSLEATWRIPSTVCGHTLAERMRWNGLHVTSETNGQSLVYNVQYCMVAMSESDLLECIAKINDDLPICNDLRTLLHFKWRLQ